MTTIFPPNIPDHPSWTFFLLSMMFPILSMIAGYWRLRRRGIDAYNLDEIKDRASFRQSTLARIKELEDKLDEMIERERKWLEERSAIHAEMSELKAQLDFANDRLSRR